MAELGYEIGKLAGPLKEMLRALLRQMGASEEKIERMIEGDLKETPCPELGGKSPRHAMQTLGEEWGRQCIGLDFWLKAALRRYEGTSTLVFVDDLRYENELEGLRRAGFVMWKITGREPKDVGKHASEEGLPNHLFDHVFFNDEGPEHFKRQIMGEVYRIAMLAERAA